MKQLLTYRRLLLAETFIALVLLSAGCRRPSASPEPVRPTVTVAAVHREELVEWDEFTGHTVAAETVEVRPRVSGHLQEVGFQSGQLVKQGDILFAALHNVLLTLQADVAQSYFALRARDAELVTVTSTVALRREQLQLVRSRFEGGIGNDLDVTRAETELAATEAEAAALAKQRAELENALAILVGANPSNFRLAPLAGEAAWNPGPPTIPSGLPSDLLERRPDVAEAERQLAAANARIGVAKSAFFPVLRLTGSGGFVSADVESLFNWESRAWSIGPSLSLPVFAGGRNRATSTVPKQLTRKPSPVTANAS